MADRKSLTGQDWASAALDALAAGGLAAVAVEPLAVRLGTTKGSFYWHFANRDALLESVLALWERTETDDVIAIVAHEPDPRTRLRMLFDLAIGGHNDHRPGAVVELALQPTSRHPLVAPVLARVTRRRLDYLAGLFGELGFGPDDARQRSLLAYSAYLGHAQLAHATPQEAPAGPALPAYVDAFVATLTART